MKRDDYIIYWVLAFILGITIYIALKLYYNDKSYKPHHWRPYPVMPVMPHPVMPNFGPYWLHGGKSNSGLLY